MKIIQKSFYEDEEECTDPLCPWCDHQSALFTPPAVLDKKRKREEENGRDDGSGNTKRNKIYEDEEECTDPLCPWCDHHSALFTPDVLDKKRKREDENGRDDGNKRNKTFVTVAAAGLVGPSAADSSISPRRARKVYKDVKKQQGRDLAQEAELDWWANMHQIQIEIQGLMKDVKCAKEQIAQRKQDV